jgi:putative two-component system response regulator
LAKPFDHAEVLLRIRNLLQTRLLSQEQQRQNAELELRVRDRTRELDESRLEILVRLARAAEYRDDATGQHAHRVGDLSAAIARQMGWSDDDVELLRRAALLHDIGKIGISDEILLKPGRYTPEEFERMKSHTVIGADLLSGSRSAVLQLGEVVARTHHERWDGSGYGAGVHGDAIPMAGRIVAVADVFDALTTARPYKPGWTVEDAVAEIRVQRGRHFDPQVVDAYFTTLAPPASEAPTEPLAIGVTSAGPDNSSRRAGRSHVPAYGSFALAEAPLERCTALTAVV